MLGKNCVKIDNGLKKQDIIIYGWGKTGKYIAFILKKMGLLTYRVTDSNSNLWGIEEDGVVVESNIEIITYALKNKDSVIIVSIDNEQQLLESMQKCEINAVSWKSVIDTWIEYKLPVVNQYKVDYTSYLQQWFLHLSEELAFWENAYAKDGAYKHDLYLKNANQQHFCEKYLNKLLVGGEIVLDVGSGVLSRYGSLLSDDKKVKLIPVDPLAYWYNKFNEKYLSEELLKKNEKIEFGIFEGLSYSFLSNSIDVVIISNALDHCIDPFRSIIECLKILKKDGVLLLKHLRREAVNEKWVGLHQWNIDITDEKELLLWNNDNFMNVSKILEGYAKIEVQTYEQDERGLEGKFGFCVAEIRKLKELDMLVLDLIKEQDIENSVKTLENLFKDMVEKDYTNQEMWIEKSSLLC